MTRPNPRRRPPRRNKEMKFDETVDLLIILADKFHVEIGDLTGIEAYAEFVRSPQYEKWLKSREKD